ncbi:MAG: hypothetical protein SGCHY_001257 [Lobulomycetales sp.]
MCSKIKLDAKNDLETIRKTVKEDYEAEIKSLEEDILQAKRQSRLAEDETSRALTQLGKYQLLIKRNGIHDTESFSVNDEKIKPDGLIDYFHHAVSSREEKLRDITFKVNIMDAVNTALDLGLKMVKIPAFLLSGGDISSLRRRKFMQSAQGDPSQIDPKNPIRNVQGHQVSLLLDTPALEDKLLYILDDLEESSIFALEDKEIEIRELNQRYALRFRELEKRLLANEKDRIKRRIARQWDQNRSNPRMLANASEMIDRLEQTTEDKIVFCDLNNSGGIEGEVE